MLKCFIAASIVLTVCHPSHIVGPPEYRHGWARFHPFRPWQRGRRRH